MQESSGRPCYDARLLLVRAGFLKPGNKLNYLTLLSGAFKTSWKVRHMFLSCLVTFYHVSNMQKHLTEKKIIKVTSAFILGSSERYI